MLKLRKVLVVLIVVGLLLGGLSPLCGVMLGHGPGDPVFLLGVAGLIAAGVSFAIALFLATFCDD